MTTDPRRVGLCFRCVHARVVRTPRSTFWRCALSETDARFERYPRLPVITCAGYEAGPEDRGGGSDEPGPPGPEN